jgi:hypothetical protein
MGEIGDELDPHDLVERAFALTAKGDLASVAVGLLV